MFLMMAFLHINRLFRLHLHILVSCRLCLCGAVFRAATHSGQEKVCALWLKS